MHSLIARTLTLRGQTVKAFDAQLSRLSRMDNELYDDKLAGDITRDMYDIKHAHFMAQKTELESKRDALLEGTQSDLEQRLALLNLSQKAAEIYQTRTVAQKRLIITKLFSNVTFNNGSVSVKYSNFVKVIADKSLKTRQILGE